MLRLKIEEAELFDTEKGEFVYLPEFEVCLNHSLSAISKWESKFETPFLENKEHTRDEMMFYIICMVQGDEDESFVYRLSQENLVTIKEYINSSQTATTFGDLPNNSSSGKPPSVITSELIYYWMIAFQIPFECQHWHLNRLLSLVRVCHTKNSKPKKMSKAELSDKYRALNEARKKQLNTSG